MVGTNAGAAYFPNPSQMLSGNVNSVKLYGRFYRDEHQPRLLWMAATENDWYSAACGYLMRLARNIFSSLMCRTVRCFPISSSTLRFNHNRCVFSDRPQRGFIPIDVTMSQPVFDIMIFQPSNADLAGRVSISGYQPTPSQNHGCLARWLANFCQWWNYLGCARLYGQTRSHGYVFGHRHCAGWAGQYCWKDCSRELIEPCFTKPPALFFALPNLGIHP